MLKFFALIPVSGFILPFMLWTSITSFAQTGPAGVNNTALNPLWLKADAGTSSTTNATPISAWNDQSGNANNASQATLNKEPLYQIGILNGMPAIFFDNSTIANDELSIADNDNLDNTAGLTIFSVTRPTSLDGAARAIVSKRDNVGLNEAYLMFYYTGNLINVDIEGNDDRFNSAMVFANNNNYIIDLLYNGTLPAASRVKLFINENLDVTKTETASVISNYVSPVTIGSLNQGDGRPFGGYIAEVIIYRKALNNAERFIVDNYLSSKYNITLTANDLYAGDTPGNGDYDFEVAGVGTDATGSNTSASSSVSGGLSVTQVSGFQNGDYLLYGHTSAANNTNTADIVGVTGVTPGRWNRIWYTDITNAGASEVVDLLFDLSDAGTPATPAIAANYVLLYRAGNSGAWTQVVNATSIAGDQISFPGVTIAADGYYTLGSHNTILSPLPIELVDFSGKFANDEVQLNWSTASELNNRSFTLEKSADGEHFIPFLEVPGAGTSARHIAYAGADEKPFATHSYYRIMQTDLDGKSTFTNVISVTTFSSSFEFDVYPNPTSDFVYIKMPANTQPGELFIYNAHGERIDFKYSFDDGIYTIDSQSFRKGLYIVRFSNGGEKTLSRQFIVK